MVTGGNCIIRGHLTEPPKSLKSSWGKVFYPHCLGSDGARIIQSKAAVCIIKYFAFDKKSDLAEHSLDQFLDMGFNIWVKKLTNFSIDGDFKEVLHLMKKMDNDISEMKIQISKSNRLEGTTLQIYPGLNHINNHLQNEDNIKLLSTGDVYTVKDWMNLNDIQLDQTNTNRLRLLTAETYKTLTGTNPCIKYKPYSRKDGRTTMQKIGNAYKIGHFHIIEAAYKKILSRT